MAPLTASPSSTLASLPGTFPPPSSPPRSPPSSLNPPRDVDPTPTGPSTTGLGRGRRISTSIQSRRTQVSLGLGVSFATMNDLGTPTAPSRPDSTSPAVSPSPPDSRNSQRTASTSSHSRRTSISSSAAPPTSAGSGSSGNNSRLPSRRPSLSHLASFLSGIEHHTRVRNPGPRGGRGVSRSASRSQSRAGERRHYRRGTGGSSADGEGDDDSESGDGGDSSDEVISPGGGTFRGAASSRASSMAARSRRSSISAGSPHPFLHSLVRENTSGGVGSGVQAAAAKSQESFWEDDDGFPIAGGEEGGIGAGESIESGWAPKTFKPLPTPRILSTEMEEEPFLDTAPSSPVPKRTRTVDSYAAAGGREREMSSGGGSEGGGLQGVDVFEEGERVGVDVWLEGRGGWVRDCFGESSEGGPGNGIGGPRELEVERRLGEGTYAIVYLVREVLYDPDPNDDDILSPIDAFTSFQFDSPMAEQSTPTVSSSTSPPTRPRITSWGSDPFSVPQQSTYGRNFALKCLCKKDLTQELIEVQRGEAVLHRALPDHEYIVRLYGAYETDDWLFLVLEYCPGRDLFYWLLESQQVGSDTMYDHRAVSPSDSGRRPLHLRNRSLDLDDDEDDPHLSRTITANNPQLDILDETPPSPSLLSSTTNTSLLSRKRLRLISRMFGQMCQAVQACHDVGIAHRDIKPENFIVVDGRAEDESGSSRVVVKITDWGLGTREEMCEDFDCGSKPYMSFECRNNLSPSYDPRQADIWSLGLVLLNLLYHRNPWADPSLDDPDFAEYVHNPRGFLQNRFEDMTDEVAGFLADRVFCDVLEMENGQLRKRVTAGEFGRWAARLVMMMDENQPRSGALTGLQDHTFELVSDVTKALPAPIIGGSSGISSSLLSQFAPAPPPASIPPPWSPNLLDDLPRDLRETLPTLREEGADRTYLTNPSTPFAFSDDESLPSPSFSPPTLPAKLPGSPPGLPQPSPAKTRLPWDTPPSPSPAPPESETSSNLAESLSRPTVPAEASSSTPPPGIPLPAPCADAAPTSPTSPVRPSLVDRQESSQLSTASEMTNGSELSNGDEVDRTLEGESAAERKDGEEGEHSSSKSKRRKRGARKSKSSRSKGGENSPPIPSPLVPGSPIGFTILEESPQDQLLQDLASASQNLARELSKTPRSYSSSHSTRNSSHSRPVPIGTQSTSALRSAVSTTNLADPLKKPAKSGGVFGRFKNLVADGNPDLEAFKQRAAERNASIGAASAPAKMEGRKKVDTPLSSRGSIGTASWGSGWSGVEGGDEAPRGRAGGEMSPGHWSSTSSRRERLDKQRRRPGEGDFSPASSTRNGTTNTISTSTLDSRNHTPLSSFSSVASTDPSSLSHSAGAGPHSSANTVRDWRQTSRERGTFSPRHGRGPSDYRTSPPSSSSSHSHHILAPSLPIGGGKPKLVDVAVDTMDLGLPAPNSPAPSTTSTLSPPPSAPINIGGATHKASLKSTTTSRASSSATLLAESSPSTAPATLPPLATFAPAAKTNKLAKMLNSISVFNRTQERGTPGSG